MRYRRMKDYPRQFRVKETGVTWRVRFVRWETMEDLDPSHSKKDPTLGLTVDEDRTIYLLLGLSPKLRWTTFLHEFIHVGEIEHGLRIKHATIHLLDTPMAELLADFEMAG